MAAESSRQVFVPALVLVSIALLLSGGAMAAWRAMDNVVESDVDFSTHENPATASRLAPLFVPNLPAEIGDMVFLNDVRLDSGPTPRLFVITGSNRLRMLVTLETNKSANPPFSKIVDVKGIIRRLPAARVLRKEWMLSKEEIDRFELQGIYIAAESITGR